MKKAFLIFLAAQIIASVSLCGQNIISADTLQKHVTLLASDSLSGRGFGFPEKQMAIDYITGQYSVAGLKPMTDDYLNVFPYHGGSYFVEGKNIIGVIEGSDPVLKNEYIVIGAHYDHLGWKTVNGEKTVYNGADDNASGVASIIEIGKLLKDAGLKRSIIIAAFDGEEAGLLGSEAFVSDSLVDPSLIKVMFSMDMVGMMSGNEGLDLDGINSLKNGKSFAKRKAAGKMIKIKRAKNSLTFNTDSWSFAEKSIPAVHVFTGLVSPYHKPGDDADLLDYEGMSSIADYVSSLVSDLADRDEIKPNRGFIRRSTDPIVEAGFRFDIGMSSLYSNDAFFKNKPVLKLGAGVVSKIKLTRMISFEPGISYNLGGSRISEGKLRLQSFSASLDLLLTTPAENISMPSTYLSLGGYYRDTFAETLSGSDVNLTGDYLVGGKGVSVGLGLILHKVQAGYRFEFGLDSSDNETVEGNSYFRSSSFSLIKFF